MNKNKDISDIITAGGDTVGIRMPNHTIALALIQALGSPITGTSANSSGDNSPSTAEDVFESLGKSVDLIIDGGKCIASGASTILDLASNEPKIVRHGVLSLEEIQRVEPTLARF